MIAPLPDLRDWLKIPDPSEDDFLTELAEGVEGRFERHMDLLLDMTDRTVRLRIFNGWVLLPDFPVSSIHGISRAVDGQAIPASKYRLDSEVGKIWFSDIIGGDVDVHYETGWDWTTLPRSIRRAYLAQVRHEYTARDQMSLKRIGDASGDSVDVIGFELLPDVRETLDLFKRVSL